MTTNESSFKTFYMDDALAGHFLLKPSIKVGTTYGRIFSRLDESQGCVEVIKRVALFIILMVIAPLSLLLVPFGLLVKRIHLAFSTDQDLALATIRRIQRSTDALISHENSLDACIQIKQELRQNSHVVNFIRRYASHQLHRIPASPQDGRVYTELSNLAFALNRYILDSIQNQLSQINPNAIDGQKIQQLRAFVTQDVDIQTFIQSENPMGIPNEILPLFNQSKVIDHWLKDYEYQLRYVAELNQGVGDHTWLGEGEIPIRDNGNCLFDAFIYQLRMKDPAINNPVAERAETMQWIRDNLATNRDLKAHLVQSMYEHYQGEQDRVRNAQQNLQAIRQMEEGYEIQITPQLFRENEEASSSLGERLDRIMGCFASTENLEPINDIVDDYLQAISQNGTYGGSAEWYALSMRHEVCVKVYSKQTSPHVISRTPQIINAQFETSDNPARCFTIFISPERGSHYNCYFPSA